MGRILIEGLAVLYDGRDAELIERHRWFINAHGYAVTSIYSACIPMHRLVMGSPPGTVLEVDHINRNRRDNRLRNLRWVSSGTNGQNAPGKGVSKFRGVHASGNKGKPWRAMVKREHLGVFETEEEAAKAYDRRAYEIYGEGCFLNFPGEVGV